MHGSPKIHPVTGVRPFYQRSSPHALSLLKKKTYTPASPGQMNGEGVEQFEVLFLQATWNEPVSKTGSSSCAILKNPTPPVDPPVFIDLSGTKNTSDGLPVMRGGGLVPCLCAARLCAMRQDTSPAAWLHCAGLCPGTLRRSTPEIDRSRFQPQAPHPGT